MTETEQLALVERVNVLERDLRAFKEEAKRSREQMILWKGIGWGIIGLGGAIAGLAQFGSDLRGWWK
jgi:hypothetical protein